MNAASVTCTSLPAVTWQAGPVGSLTDELAVFGIAPSDSTALLPHLRKLLSPDEMARAARYRRPEDQLRFSGTRGLLRVLLARYTHQPADRIEFVAGVNRKPELKIPTGWHFNVSHSGNRILIAIGKPRLGVDLEWINPDFPFRDVLPVSFSPEEQEHIEACPDARLCFYRLWTRKEALVKATAKGMDDDFSRIPSLTGTHPTDSQLIGQDGHWTVVSFTIADGYPAAVAHDGPSVIIPQFYALNEAWLIDSN